MLSKSVLSCKIEERDIPFLALQRPPRTQAFATEPEVLAKIEFGNGRINIYTEVSGEFLSQE